MSISLKCSCGKSLSVKDELAGRKVRCPACTSIQTVPLPVVPEIESLDVLEEIPATRVQAKPPRLPPPLPFENQIETLPSALPLRRGSERFEDDEEEVETRRRRRRLAKASANQGGIGTANASIGGGIAMIVIAVVWFFGGLLFNYIFFYPPILFVLGIVAIVKGAVSKE